MKDKARLSKVPEKTKTEELQALLLVGKSLGYKLETLVDSKYHHLVKPDLVELIGKIRLNTENPVNKKLRDMGIYMAQDAKAAEKALDKAIILVQQPPKPNVGA